MQLPRLSNNNLALIYQRAGNLDHAVAWYEQLAKSPWPAGFLGVPTMVGVRRYQLAVDDQERGQTGQARQTIAKPLDLWKDAISPL